MDTIQTYNKSNAECENFFRTDLPMHHMKVRVIVALIKESTGSCIQPPNILVLSVESANGIGPNATRQILEKTGLETIMKDGSLDPDQFRLAYIE